MIMLESAKVTTETVDALRSGAQAMRAQLKTTKIDDVDKTMDEINESTEDMKAIQEALSTPVGGMAEFDDVSTDPLSVLLFWQRRSGAFRCCRPMCSGRSYTGCR